MRRRERITALALISTLAMTCPSAKASQSNPQVVLTVFAASSLSQTFTQIANNFHRKNPEITVKFSYLASSVLASQISSGAPADIFAAASPRDMSLAGKSILASRVFASNRIVLSFPKEDANLVRSFKDLNRASVRWIQCAPSVACGVTTNSALGKLGQVRSKPVSYEPKVSSVVTKLLDREVDAAFIYHTDYVAHRSVLRELSFPSSIDSTTNYPIALVSHGKHKAEAQRFIDEIFTASSRKILTNAGFGKPS